MKKIVLVFLMAFLFASCNWVDTPKVEDKTTETDKVSDKTPENKNSEDKTSEEDKTPEEKVVWDYKEHNSTGFSFMYPKDWEFSKNKGIVQVLSPLWEGDLFAENVNFIEQDYKTFNLDYDTFYKQNVAGVKNMLKSKSGEVVSEEDVKVAWKDAKKLIYNFVMQWVNIKTTQYFLDNDGKAYIITFTNKKEAPDEKKEEFTKILESFKLK